MNLNDLKPASGAKTKKIRVGRGIGSGFGKTCGRGHKGQHSRSGGYHKTGFEGGQMPLQRRLPKVGFRSLLTSRTASVRIGELNQIDGDNVDIEILKKNNLIPQKAKKVKIFLSGQIARPFIIKGIKCSSGVKAAIEAAGGKIEE